MKNYEFLTRLQADREFADYLIANGWGVVIAHLDLNNPILREHETITFSKQDKQGFCHLLVWVSSYQYGTSFVHTYKGKTIGKLAGCVSIEGDTARFAFLADVMGWVSLSEAQQNSKAQNEVSLFEMIADAVKPKQHENQTHNLSTSLVAAALQMAEQ